MPMPNRSTINNQYRYAYQGQEKDPETGKEAFELRLWDSRIGRWLTTDPYGQHYSPYLGMGNNPINRIDPDGGQCRDIKGNLIDCGAHKEFNNSLDIAVLNDLGDIISVGFELDEIVLTANKLHENQIQNLPIDIFDFDNNNIFETAQVFDIEFNPTILATNEFERFNLENRISSFDKTVHNQVEKLIKKAGTSVLKSLVKTAGKKLLTTQTTNGGEEHFVKNRFLNKKFNELSRANNIIMLIQATRSHFVRHNINSL